jgi:hypothetical protein
MPYTKPYPSGFQDLPSTTTPFTASVGNSLQDGIATAQATAEAAPYAAATKNTIAGTTYTLVAGDVAGLVLHTTSGSAVTITLPQDSAATIAQEAPIPWRQYGAGQITFAAGAGATLVSRGGATKSAGQYAGGTVTKVAANTWLLEGDIST